MQTNLSEAARTLPGADVAEGVLRTCVHCGFCNATCPTYQLLGDELDGPRGRIYLMKQMLEGNEVSASTRQHLDRCLSCRNSKPPARLAFSTTNCWISAVSPSSAGPRDR